MKHLRGRVYFAGHYANGHPVYAFDVINDNTGAVVASDNHCGWMKAHDDVREMVTAARGAWMYGFRQKDLG